MEQKTFFIVGCTGGMGSLLTHKLLGAGHKVFGMARDKDKLEEMRKQAERGFAYCSGDAAQAEDFDRAIEAFGKFSDDLHGAVNLAGSILIKPLAMTKRRDLEATMNQNFYTAFYTLQKLIPLMQKSTATPSMQERQSGGSLVLMSSCAAQIGLDNHAAISAAKGAVEGLVRSTAASCAKKWIRVNAIAPSLTQTPLAERLTSNQAAVDKSLSYNALKRLADPKDIVGSILWLLSEDSAFMTGEILRVDGGLAGTKI